MIGRYAREHKEEGLAVVFVIPAGDEGKAKPLWEQQKMADACLLADPATFKDWEATPGIYYLIGKDGKFAGGILTGLPTEAQLKAACAAP